MLSVLPQKPQTTLRILALSLFHFLPVMYRACIPLLLLGVMHILYAYLVNMTAHSLIASLTILLVYSAITVSLGMLVLQIADAYCHRSQRSTWMIIKQARYRLGDVLGGFFLLIIGACLITILGWYAGLGIAHLFKHSNLQPWIHLWITASFPLCYFCAFGFALPILSLEKISLFRAAAKTLSLLYTKSCWVRQALGYIGIALYFLMMNTHTHHAQWLIHYHLFESFQLIWTLVFFPFAIVLLRFLLNDCELRKEIETKIQNSA